MILSFSSPSFIIPFICLIVGYKYFFRKSMLANAILDFFSGIIILFISTGYFEKQIPHSNGHGSAMLSVFNFIFFTALYIISTITLYWKKSKTISIWVPVGLYIFYMMYVFSSFEFASIYRKSVLLPIFLSFFPIYICNYFRVLKQ